MASGCGGISCFFRLFFGTLAVVWFICVLLVGTLETQGGTTKSSATSKPADALGKDNLKASKLVHPELDLNYMSKRRVPNGPDPIHNRRAGNSGRPPGQS